MPIAYPVTNELTQVFLSKEEIASLFYHDIFEYPLTMNELIKWSVGEKILSTDPSLKINTKSGYFFLNDREGIVLKRLMRKRISVRKFEIAKEATRIFSLVPTIKMVAVTGALAMENAADESDVDLLIITKKSSLWTTRLLVYLLFKVFHFNVRKPKEKFQKDKFCLNMWLDEDHLSWPSQKRNIYTAHEIAQIRPLINKDLTYEKFISKNRWVQNFWPNTVKVDENLKFSKRRKTSFSFGITEKLAFWFQYRYMRKKITREIVTPTRALFHPVDWSKFVLQKLSP